MNTILKQRYIETNLDVLLLEMETKSLKKVKCEFINKKDRMLGLGKTFYIKERHMGFGIYNRIDSSRHYEIDEQIKEKFKNLQFKVYV
jgi:hypothetical protein